MKTLFVLAAALALCGCATEATRTDDAATLAVRTALAAHVINPAGAAAAEVAGLDGRAAREAQQRYEKSFGGKESSRTYAPDMGTEK